MPPDPPEFFSLSFTAGIRILQIQSSDGVNRLTRSVVNALTGILDQMKADPMPLVITGNDRFFSAGADLREVTALTGPAGYEFSCAGQQLMNTVATFPATVCAAVRGYCMGGGLDLALACHHRIASPDVTFGHRGAALGLITGWGGTQRLSRLIGKAAAVRMFVMAETIDAELALEFGLVDQVATDPVQAALQLARDSPLYR